MSIVPERDRLQLCRLFVWAILFQLSGQGFATDHDDATQSVDRWFVLIDESEFARAWDELALIAQQEWSKDYWLFSLEYVHEHVGTIESRYLTNSWFEYESQGDIDEIVFTYQSDYTQLQGATEIVRVARENSDWKVISYELKNPANETPVEYYASKEECQESFDLAEQYSYVDHRSEPAAHLTAFLNAVATGRYRNVERFRLIQDQKSLDSWRNPQCFLISEIIDLQNLYPESFCFQNEQVAIEVLEKRPDDTSYYSLRQRDGAWQIHGWRSKEAFESCLNRELR